MSDAAHGQVRLVTKRTDFIGQLKAVWLFKELLVGLVRKELRVKYRGTALGFAWSLLNPALSIAIYYLVFDVILESGIPVFTIYLLSGLLVWNLFSSGVAAAAGSVVGNAPLVNKVYFPRLVLPISAVGASIVHFALQGLVLIAALFVVGVDIELTWLPIALAAFLVLVLLTLGVGVLLSSLNVHFRDTQHVLELLLLGWFWTTPIVFHYQLVADKLAANSLPVWLALLNPITSLTLVFQRVFHNHVFGDGSSFERPGLEAEGPVLQILPAESWVWYLRNVGIIGLVSAVLFVVAVEVFSRLEGNFAEEL